MVPSPVSTASSGAAAQRRRGRTQPPPMATVDNSKRAAAKRRRGRTQPSPPPMATVENPDRAACGRDWSALADLPLSVVAQRLHSLRDFLSFRGVCRSWRSVGVTTEGAVMASHPPLFFEFNLRRFYHPGEMRFYQRTGERRFYRRKALPMEKRPSVIGHSHGHIILTGIFGQPWLANPLTGAEHRCFPRWSPLVCKCRAPRSCFPECPRPLGMCKATLSSPPAGPGCVLVVYDKHCIEYCRAGDERWFRVQGIQGKAWEDIGEGVQSVAVVGGKGYVWLHEQGLASFVISSTHDPTLTIMDAYPPLPRGGASIGLCFSLAEFRGELLAFSVIWGDHFSHFAVFRFDASSCCKWLMLQDLGGRAAFVEWWRSALFVANHAKWGESCKDRIHLWEARGGNQPLRCEVNDETSDPFLPFRRPHKDVGLWVLPSLLSSTSL